MSPFSLDHITVSSNSDSQRYASHNGRVPLSLVPLPYAVNDQVELEAAAARRIGSQSLTLEIKGFEPSTYGLQSRRSSQLSYIPSYDKEGRAGRIRAVSMPIRRPLRERLSRRKEVIQPHLPVRLPCYDFTLLMKRTFDVALHCWLD